MSNNAAPFHAGEIEAQRRAGAGDVSAWASGFIRDFMPDQHRAFYRTLPFLALSGADGDGRIWATLVEGPDGFVRSPDRRRLTLSTALDPQDPLTPSLERGSEIGMLGIDLASRRRNRLSGVIRADDCGFSIDVRQSFGNCPQYISPRGWRRAAHRRAPEAIRSDRLSDDQISRIRAADTLFVGTGQQDGSGASSNGYDASHRGGAPGFVRVIDGKRLRIPDYAGNNFFNTIGNILKNPKIGLVFVDFETGGLLQASGRAKIDWSPPGAENPEARRMIDVTIDRVVDRPRALSLRWREDASGRRDVRVKRKVAEARDIASFYLAPLDGAPLENFEAGRHLPIELFPSGRKVPVRRTYSLSAAADGLAYRITVKREPKGVASRFLHDEVAVGDVLRAYAPSGDFVVPDTHRPLALISAGVGLTPMLAILRQTATQAPGRPVWFAHGARDGEHHALRAEVEAIVAANGNFARRFHYSRPSSKDRLSGSFDEEGRITADAVLRLGAGRGAYYMLCGPTAFLADIRAGLEAEGVPAGQILHETFGPGS